ncbi:MAG: glycosyltransferase family 2 protein, partial [Gammaproteobacteria bacterium]
FRLKVIQNFSAVTAACLLVQKTIYDQVGGLNEKDLPVAFNDVDFCIKVREAGYRNVWTPYAELYHLESTSRGAEDSPVKRSRAVRECLYMQQKWESLLQNDPYYSPHLTKDAETFSLAT